MAKAVLLFDAIAWVDEDGTRHDVDGKGKEADVTPKDEFDRLVKLGAIAAPKSKNAKEAAAEAAAEAEV